MKVKRECEKGGCEGEEGVREGRVCEGEEGV